MLYTIINNVKRGENLTTEKWTGQEWSIKDLKNIKANFGFETVEVSDKVFILQGQFGNDYYQWIFIEEE